MIISHGFKPLDLLAEDFEARKRQILTSLDRSPKGSLDAPIVMALSYFNHLNHQGSRTFG